MAGIEVLPRAPYTIPEEDVSLKSLGLAVMSFIVEAISGEDADLLAPAVDTLAEYTASLPPKALFPDWATQGDAHTLPLIIDGSYDASKLNTAVDGGIAICKASPTNEKSPPEAAIASGSTSYWAAPNDTNNSTWEVKLALPTYTQYVTINWRGEPVSKSYPESYTVSITEDGKTWKQVGAPIVIDSLPKSEILRQQVPLGHVVSQVKIDMKGYAKNLPDEFKSTPKEKAHAIKSVTFHVPDTLAVHVSPGTTLYDLEKLLYNAAVGSSSVAHVVSALRGLESLALASGSAQGMLKLVTALLALQTNARYVT